MQYTVSNSFQSPVSSVIFQDKIVWKLFQLEHISVKVLFSSAVQSPDSSTTYIDFTLAVNMPTSRDAFHKTVYRHPLPLISCLSVMSSCTRQRLVIQVSLANSIWTIINGSDYSLCHVRRLHLSCCLISDIISKTQQALHLSVNLHIIAGLLGIVSFPWQLRFQIRQWIRLGLSGDYDGWSQQSKQVNYALHPFISINFDKHRKLNIAL